MKRPKLKKASKRMTCHKRYKIQKKVREHNRKLRKEAKKHGHKKPKKDPGIPNTAPFKEEVLREAQQRKQRLEELKQRQKLDRQKELEKKRKQEANKKDNSKTKKSIAGEKAESKQQLDKNSKKSFCIELKKVIESSDVVLEVLDARDPLGSRCPEVEQLVSQLDGDKKLLLVLNKIDLVPKENLEKWLNYLNNEIPTVAFKSSMLLKDKTVQEKKHTRRRSAYIELSRASLCFGNECLLKLLRQYSMTKDRVIQVGVVGFPNVGKSSIINSLKEVRACNVGPVRGLTKCSQAVHIDKQIKMFDTPCIVAAPSNSPLALALRSTTDMDAGSLVDAVDAILKHCNKQQIMLYYNISDYRSSLEFLTLLAQKRGMLKKGGLADTEGAAKLLLHDWSGAKVNYYSRPPAAGDSSPHLTREASAAAEQDINFEDLEEDNKSTIKANKYPNQASCILFQSPGFTNGIIEDNKLPDEVFEQEEEEMKGSEDELMEDDIGGDSDDAEQEENRTESGTIASEDLTARLSTGNQFHKEKTDNLDDAYDFSTDYI